MIGFCPGGSPCQASTPLLFTLARLIRIKTPPPNPLPCVTAWREHTRAMSSDSASTLPRRAFGIALGFLLVVALTGTLLRWQMVYPVPGLNAGHLLHAHSHVAFLGWVFNAFVALGLVAFLPASAHAGFRRLFVVLQIAVLGMLVTYPFTGYAPASIAFSTLHLIGAAVFAWRLWHGAEATPVARAALRVALAFLVLSGVGPLALGPLAAFDLREHPAYQLSIYFYLHGQYNGWFVFFLLALLFQSLARTDRLDAAREAVAANALRWLAVGAVLTFAQSTLWLSPPGWVYTLAALGGLVQLVGCAHLLRVLRGAGDTVSGTVRALVVLALGAFLLKQVLQAGAAWPALDALANHRFIVIAFLHLVFLGVVAPAIFAYALHLRWLRDGPGIRAALTLFFSAAAFTELVLVAVALGKSFGMPIAPTLFAAALAMSVAVVGLLRTLRAGGETCPFGSS